MNTIVRNKIKITLSLLCGCCSLFSNPSGGEVRKGEASIATNGNDVSIVQKSDKAVIHWDNFSIAHTEKTKFIQPSPSSQVLNRVVGTDMSKIYGSLESNGCVYLINPHGVIIGPGGKIDTHGFMASTFDIQDEDFLQGKELHFTGSTKAKILNEGAILSKSHGVILIAQEIENAGTISSDGGNVDLIAGYEVLLIPSDQRKIAVRLKKEGQIKNTGFIEAVEAKLQASGGRAYDFAIDHQGIIEAKGFEERNGKIILISNENTRVSGKMKAENSNATGGEIQVLGKCVRLENGTDISASGNNGGGCVLVGGDYQGKNPDIFNARDVHVDKDAEIHADALKEGKGGKVIFWGDDEMAFHGIASAEGGKEKGDGGFIEISSHGIFSIDGSTISTKAYHGKCGQLLFDPVDLTISTSPTSGVLSPQDPPPPEPHGGPYNYLFSAEMANININALLTFLNDNDVTINTHTGVDYPVINGDITIETPIIYAGANHLTLMAARNMIVNENITLTNGGILTLGVGQNDISGSLIFANDKRVTGIPDASGKIVTGGKGTNSIDYSAYSSNITVNVDSNYSGEATGIVGGGFEKIQNITGGAGMNTFTFAGDMETICPGNTPKSSNTVANCLTFNSGRVESVDGDNTSNDYYINGGTIGTLTGSGLGDQIFGPYCGATWDITGTNSGSLMGSVVGCIDSFTNIENLSGTAGSNTFVFHEGGNISGDIEGGIGTNTLDYTDCSGVMLIDLPNQSASYIDGSVKHIQNGKITEGAFFGGEGDGIFSIQNRGTVKGGEGTNTLIGLDSENTWTVYVNSGTIATTQPSGTVTFTHIQKLQGVGDKDTFILKGYGLINSIQGNGSNSNLTGPDGHSTWEIIGSDRGSIHGSGTTIFTQIESLSGGSGDDTFIMYPGAKITGILDGKGGYNVIDYSSYHSPVIADWKNHSATNINYFGHIQRIIYSPETFRRANAGLIVDTLQNYLTLSHEYSRLWKYFNKVITTENETLYKKKLQQNAQDKE